MAKLHKNQYGFSTVEMIFILVVVALISVVGWTVYKDHHSSKPVNTGTATTIQQEAAKNIVGYNKLPADFQPIILSQYQKVVDGCSNNPDAKTNGVTAGMTVSQVLDSFISINEQQIDCNGSAMFYYSKINGAWQFDFMASQTPGCNTVNKFSYTKLIIPQCYPDNSSDVIANMNL